MAMSDEKDYLRALHHADLEAMKKAVLRAMYPLRIDYGLKLNPLLKLLEEVTPAQQYLVAELIATRKALDSATNELSAAAGRIAAIRQGDSDEQAITQQRPVRRHGGPNAPTMEVPPIDYRVNDRLLAAALQYHAKEYRKILD